MKYSHYSTVDEIVNMSIASGSCGSNEQNKSDHGNTLFVPIPQSSEIEIGQNQKPISITSPGDSRSTSPDLNNLLSKREPKDSFTESESDENLINNIGSHIPILNSSSQCEEEDEDVDEDSKFISTFSDSLHEDDLETENDNNSTASASSIDNRNYKIKKPAPLGKRALLKKLSEGTLVKRQSERHHHPHQLRTLSSSPSPQNLISKEYKPIGPNRRRILKFQQPVELLDLEALRRYRKVYKLSIRPTASKSNLMRTAVAHFAKMHPDPNEVISKFLLALRSNRECK